MRMFFIVFLINLKSSFVIELNMFESGSSRINRKTALTWWFSRTERSLYKMAKSLNDWIWKLLVWPVCSKSCIIAAKMQAKTSNSFKHSLTKIRWKKLRFNMKLRMKNAVNFHQQSSLRHHPMRSLGNISSVN